MLILWGLLAFIVTFSSFSTLLWLPDLIGVKAGSLNLISNWLMKPLPMGRCVKTLTLEVRIRSQDNYYPYLPYLCTRSRTIIQVKVNCWPLTPFPFIYTVLFRLHPYNVLGIRSFGDQYMCTNLVDATNKYLQKHFKDVMKSEEFYNLSVTDIQDIICRDELNIESEEQVLLFFVW